MIPDEVADSSRSGRNGTIVASHDSRKSPRRITDESADQAVPQRQIIQDGTQPAVGTDVQEMPLLKQYSDLNTKDAKKDVQNHVLEFGT